MVKKPILRSNSLNFFVPIGFSGKVDFFKIAVINPFMNRFQKGLLIPRGHSTCEITHHSDIDISKFHSRLFRVIGFFGTHLKSPSFVRNFFRYFFWVGDVLNSLWLDFHFSPTTLVFWDFWGSVGTFVFSVWFPPYVCGFVLTPTTGRYAQFAQTVAVSVTYLSTHFFYDTWKPGGGLGAPPARHLIW